MTKNTPAPQTADLWVDRVDALAGELASLRTRSAILDHVVREVMRALPAEAVIVHADEAPLAIEPTRTVIPLATAGRRFGALEIAMRPDRPADPVERGAGRGAGAAGGAGARACGAGRRGLAAPPEASATVSPPPADVAAIARALDRLTADVHRLAGLARSAALPPAGARGRSGAHRGRDHRRPARAAGARPRPAKPDLNLRALAALRDA